MQSFFAGIEAVELSLNSNKNLKEIDEDLHTSKHHLSLWKQE